MSENGAPGGSRRHERGRGRRGGRVVLAVVWAVVLVGGLLALASQLDPGPERLHHSWVANAGAVAVEVSYAWALATRSGSRPLIVAALTLVAGTGVVLIGTDELRTGAAVITAATGAVLGVMTTVPVQRMLLTVREVLAAAVIAAVGGVAALGFEPVVTVSRYQFAVLACALVGAFGLVYRLGAGLHGLGRRGVFVVAGGGLMLAVTLLYAEMIRRYGAPDLIGGVHDGLDWCRDHLGGYPRPIEALLGIPALVWGTHMRARRRQGWWVCLFGVALTAPVATTLANPDLGVLEALAGIGYSLVLGLIIGVLIIRLDLALTGVPRVPSGEAPGRRVAREAAEDTSAVRAEPGRGRPLL
ncbi:MAG: hypothetical protein QM638_08105 [Nocardioides sp.]|uniref:hypothetical protein n=1 Tax=Nocardioides sp. TaxID=35761 RepID=UPI0039E56755